MLDIVLHHSELPAFLDWDIVCVLNIQNHSASYPILSL